MKATIFAAIALLAAGSANAVDYTINVPVNVSSYPPSKQLELRCNLCTASGGCRFDHQSQGPGTDVVAHAQKPVPLSNGAYSGTMQMVFSMTDDMVGRAQRYKCTFSNNPSGTLQADSVKPNSKSVTSVEGPVQ
jgi:hypothetical protein